MTISMDDAQRRAEQLYTDLSRIAERDPEQEVRGIALPVPDACIATLRKVVPDDPVISQMPYPYSAESIEAGEPVRAVDALVGHASYCLSPDTWAQRPHQRP